MRQLLQDPNAREKSVAQIQGILAVMPGRQDTMITMRTGGGKSMFWLVPPLLDPTTKLLVVCPPSGLLSALCRIAHPAAQTTGAKFTHEFDQSAPRCSYARNGRRGDWDALDALISRCPAEVISAYAEVQAA